MPEGTSTFMGRGVGLRGNYQIQGDNDTDDTLTITGASSSAAGDILVVQNSTGTELFVISASGFVTQSPYGVSIAGASSFASTLTVTGALTLSGTGTSVAAAGGITAVLPSSGWGGALTISITTTGAITSETGSLGNAILVSASSKSTLNSVVQYDSGKDADSAVSYLAVKGTKAPSYFLKVGNSAFGLGAGADNGFFDASMALSATTSISTLTNFCGLKIMAGTQTYYLLGIPATHMT